LEEPLLELRLAVVTAPDRILPGDGASVELAAIAAEPLIMYELPVGYGEIVHALYGDIGRFPSTAMLADNIETMKAIVAEGIGIALMPEISASQEVQLGILRAYALMPQRHVPFALYRRRHLVSDRRELYFKAILEALRERERRPATPSEKPMHRSPSGC
jgi:DNA-binding transcriptional LysR family regulator